MTRVLVTGASGFAGGHLVAACAEAGDEVAELSRTAGLRVELLDAAAVRGAVRETAPAVVHHLAALAHVGRSWQEPEAYLRENVAMTLNVLEAVRAEAPTAAVVVVASGELYGPPASLPVDETAPLRPQNPYAVSKAGADLLAGFYADAHGLRVIRARAFNHAGPGQKPIYAVASFARQAAAGLVAGEDPVRVVTGNPDARRDYTDVRDVVRAYRALAVQGEPGAYNVCSGRTASAAELVAALGRAAGVEIDLVVDPALRRAHEVMEVRGSYARLHEATGWEPEIPLEQTLADTVEWWVDEIRSGRAGGERHE
ncbi:MAG TPA: GDP-mannose 4,6-dehydratase [Solirubrobacteraceae bacterium]|nr:GDP-mannose 4,6-dehydratase [Solirubrobacteraceae bacterium]